MFKQHNRIDVDVVEADFVNYKIRHPEEDSFLLERFTVPEEFAFTLNALKNTFTKDELRIAKTFSPWGYSFQLTDDVSTDAIDFGRIDAGVVDAGRNEFLLRMSMLEFIFETFDLGSDWVDVATNCGIIPLLISRRRPINTFASDWSEHNIAKANFLKQLSGVRNCTFEALDAFEHLSRIRKSESNLVSALGIFYHLSNPIGLLELMFGATSKYVLIDTIVHNFGFSGWIQTVSRHVKHPELSHANDTRKILELHPTYRGLVDALYQVGFSDVVEIVPNESLLAKFPGTIYHTLNRRILLATKKRG